uniref:Uncharacterized protein n=2 Tax=Oryza sativa subsp. japonica TaxID=39947 RepID=A0A5S6R984_ORYSJ|nr:hypothetical protein [Oryza sativa Japonica Group]AAP54242.1 hypothetical protein LOC_Os10g33400 [Oryza sativa Japonica Group]
MANGFDGSLHCPSLHRFEEKDYLVVDYESHFRPPNQQQLDRLPQILYWCDYGE